MKLIKIQGKFILTSNEEALKAGDYTIMHPSLEIYQVNQSTCIIYDEKIIAGIPSLPSIDFSLLTEEDCKEIGWYGVEKLADESVEYDTFPNIAERKKHINRFIEGFQTAQLLKDKQFSLDDMVSFSKWVADSKKHGFAKQLYEAMIVNKVNTVEELINIWQSQEQTEWDVEVEMEGYKRYGMIDEATSYRPKITNNSIKITKIFYTLKNLIK